MPPTLISILRNITLKEKAGKKKRKEKKKKIEGDNEAGKAGVGVNT